MNVNSVLSHVRVQTLLLLLPLLCQLQVVTPDINVLNCNGGLDQDVVVDLPGYPVHDAPHLVMYSGFLEANRTANGHLFYWFVESLSNPNDTETPILVWLNGGPGASSMTGLFAENGPFTINDDDLSLSYNPYGWHTHYHMLYIDNPIDTGFSFCDRGAWVQNEDQMGEQFVTALNIFFSACHSKYARNPLYISGESYAGRYIPFIAKWLYLKGNALNLRGLAIGNGHYDPFVMFRTGPRYALVMGVIDENEYAQTMHTVDECLNLTATDCALASDLCLNVTNNIYAMDGGNIFQYNILTLNGTQFNGLTASIAAYLNQSKVAHAIHTLNISAWKSSDGTSAPNPVFDALKCDIVANNSAELIPVILSKGTRILFYSGQFDGSVWGNRQTETSLNNLNYNGDWINLKRTPFYTDFTGKKLVAGYVKQSVDKLLTYVVVSGSGHLVPYDVPQNALAMMTTFVDNKSWS